MGNVCFISNFSGDCCNPALRINVIDVDGFISQCELSFSNRESVQSVEIVSVSTNKPVSFCQMLEINKVFKCCGAIFFISSTDPKGHMIYCHHFVSDVRLSIAIMHIVIILSDC